jgi:hypothetical protein
MVETCLNCGKPVNDNYCGNCGQKKYCRIDRKYILVELEDTILQTNKGFLYSIKRIVVNPGKTAKEFIRGSRINHYKPILLAFLLSGIYAFISFKIIGLKEITEEFYTKQQMSSQFMIDYLSFASSYNSLIMLSLIPFLAIVTKMAFRKWGDNYYEHIIMNAYILSFYLILNIVIIYPSMYFLKGDPDFIVQLSSLSILIVPIIMIWFYKGYYLEKSFKRIISRVLLIILIILIAFFFLLIASIIGGFIFAMIKGPEALDAIEYIKPQ